MVSVDKLIELSILGELSLDEELELERRLQGTPGEYERWLQMKRIARIALESPPVSPEGDFKDRVMQRILASGGCEESAVSERPCREDVNAASMWGILGMNGLGECAFSFLISGFFYLVFSASLSIALRVAGFAAAGPLWLRAQPLVAFLIAVGFVLIALLLWKTGLAALMQARAGVLVYIGAVVMNGVVSIRNFDDSTVSLVLFGLVAAQAVMGILLASNLRRVQPV